MKSVCAPAARQKRKERQMLHVPLPRAGGRALAAVAGALVVAWATPALANPGVEPAAVDRNANPGTSFDVDKTVHTPEIPPKPDIVLLVDTTGSMGSAIANVRTNLHTVVTDVRAAQPAAEF